MKHSLLLSFALLCATACLAQVSLETCQRQAQHNFPLIKRRALYAQSTAFTIANLKKGWLPQVQATAQATMQNRVAELPSELNGMLTAMGRDLRGLAKEQYRVGVDVNQMLWDGGRIGAQRQVALLQQQANEAQTDVSLYQVRQRVNDLYFGILLIDERLQLNTDLQTLLLSNENKLAALQKQGVALQSDVDQLRAERLTAMQTTSELQHARQALCQMLALFCNVDHIDSIEKPTSTDNQETAEDVRPELKVIDLQLRLVASQQRALHSSLLPTLSIFGQAYYGYPGFDMFKDMNSRSPSFNAIAGVRLAWSIGNLYTHRNNMQRLKVSLAEIENARELFLFNNRLETIKQQAAIESKRQILNSDNEIVVLRQNVRRAAEAKLANGIIDTNSLLQEITRENNAKINRSTHEVEMLQGIYNLKYVKGEPTIPKQATPYPASPPTPLQGERGVICKATTRTNKHNNHAPTRHFTPLSPWRGAGGEARNNTNNMKHPLITIATLALLAAACCSNDKEYDATGIFEATEVTVSAEGTGRLMVLNLTEGTAVKVGQQVGLIDTVQLQLKAKQMGASKEVLANQRPNVQAQIAALQQQINKALIEQRRTEALLKDGAATSKQLDDAQNAVAVLQKQLQGQLSLLQNSTRSLNSQMSAADIQRYEVLDQLEKCRIKSPITGTVLEKYAEQGEFATIGRPLFKVADTRNMTLRAYITSTQLAKVRVGQRVKVFADYGNNTQHTYQGLVTWISPKAEFTPKSILTNDERADQVYAVKVSVKNNGYIKIGMYGEMKL